MHKPSKLLVILSIIPIGIALVFLAAILGLIQVTIPGTNAFVSEPDYWPTAGWKTSTPEEQGMDSAKLLAVYDYIGEHDVNLHSLIVIRHGYIVTESYFYPYKQYTSHQIASVTKSVIGTSIGIAIDQGSIRDVNQTVVSFFPDRAIQNLDENKRALTVKQLLALTTSFECEHFISTQLRMEQSSDWAGYMLDLPLMAAPGTSWYYCSPAVNILSAILQRSTGMTAREFANKNLFAPLGIREVTEAQWAADPQGVSRGDIGLALTSQDMAKLGFLYLHGGSWDGTKIVSREWIAAATTKQAAKDDGNSYGYLWTIYPGQSHYAALGVGGQQIHVLPEFDLVVVTTAGLPFGADAPDILTMINDYIVPAVKSAGAIPANPDGASALKLTETVLRAPALHSVSFPTLGYLVSGRTYILESNLVGWKQISVDFERGSDIALVTQDDLAPYRVGLDGRFQMVEQGVPMITALRGAWISDHAFQIDMLQLGNISEYTITLTFGRDDIEITIVDPVLNTMNVTIHGVAAD